MGSDTTLAGSLGWIFWFCGELAFKWIPGLAASLTGAQGPSSMMPPTPAPLITSAVTVQQVADFLQTSSAPGVYDQLFHAWSIFVGGSIILSLVLSAIIIYCVTRVFQIRRAEYRRFEAAAHTVTAHDIPKTRLRWNRILEQAHSESEQQWRLAILEADIMLNELLDDLGMRGETIADKMRNAERGTFNTIDLAWEAHRIRNRIAHEAITSLSGSEVRRIIGLYEKVFREFEFIK